MNDTVTAALVALAGLGDPLHIAMLLTGVAAGLVIGIIPGLGGLVGLTLVLPFTFHMEPMMALSVMIGLHAVVATSDSIPAILFGVPGTVGSAATTLDGYPLARQGQAGRALDIAFASSLLGGIFGACVLAASIPVMRPMILFIGSPEMFALCVLGLSLVVVLSGRRVLPGLVAACLGLLLSMVGEDYQSGTMRWTFDTLYLWSGVPLVPFALGLFALPEIAELAIRRKSIADSGIAVTGGRLAALRDLATHWVVIVRSSAIGSLLGAMPGIGSSIIDWVAYGSAVRRAGPGARFGEGDIRGVIASEASNNAKEGGALIPTLAFGVPGSAAMAILLGAFSMHGLVPGPDMLDKNLHITFGVVFSLVAANIVGAGVCFLFAPRLARIALIPFCYLAPIAIAVTVWGALQGERQWADLAVFFAAGGFGLLMRVLGWPRPPLMLGFVLGLLIERYMATSWDIYGIAFLARPIVAALLVLAAWGLLKPAFSALLRARREGGRSGLALRLPPVNAAAATAAALACLFAIAVWSASWWGAEAARMPTVVALFGMACAILSLVVVRRDASARPQSAGEADPGLAADDLPPALFRRRLASYCLWTLATVPAALLLGPVPGVALWMLAWMTLSLGVVASRALVASAVTGLLAHLLFDRLLQVPWPRSGLDLLLLQLS